MIILPISPFLVFKLSLAHNKTNIPLLNEVEGVPESSLSEIKDLMFLHKKCLGK